MTLEESYMGLCERRFELCMYVTALEAFINAYKVAQAGLVKYGYTEPLIDLKRFESLKDHIEGESEELTRSIKALLYTVDSRVQNEAREKYGWLMKGGAA